MKKLILFISLVFVSFTISAQSSITLKNNADGSFVTNSSIIELSTTVGGLADENDFTITNVSGSSKDYHIRRIDDKLHVVNYSTGDSAIAYFCFGTQCYPETTTLTPSPTAITPAGTQALKTYLQEASTLGYSSIRYQIFDANNTSDMFTFTLSYNTALSVKENSGLFSSVSNVFPNPANNSANIKLLSSVNIKSAEVKITNTLGTVVYSNNTELNSGENTVHLNTENLPSGIYFSTIVYGKNKIVKKFTVNK
jgi:hypothetical protein